MPYAITPELRTVADHVRAAASAMNRAGLVFGHGTDNAIDEALALVLHALALDHELPDWVLGTRVSAAEAEAIAGLVGRRIDTRKPAAYLTGTMRFCGLDFAVDERVLVPRSPIAELIQAGFAPWLEDRPVDRILDLCCGSGCIGIACAMAFPDAAVDLSDRSPDALAVARANVARHGLEGRVAVFESDLFAQLPAARYELIVTNPPYVADAVVDALPAEYHAEPRMGLVAGDDGLDFARRILAAAPDWLADDGILVIEVGLSLPAFARAFRDLAWVEAEFERGGEGVVVIERAALDQWRDG